jgi:phosphatidylserine/phosphatidylglycerophosphate/cardiolipin synthase-like enzyme
MLRVRDLERLWYDARMVRWYKRLRRTFTLLLAVIILSAGGYLGARLAAGMAPDEIRREVEAGASWVRAEEGAVTRFVRRALRPVANPGDTLRAVRDGVQEARREVAQWTRSQRSSIEDGRDLIKGLAQQNQQQPGSMQSLITTAQEYFGVYQAATRLTQSDAVQVYFRPALAPTDTRLEDALLDFIAGAQRSVDCSCYDLDWEALAKALLERSTRGVRVRLVIDSDHAGTPSVELLLAAGLPIVMDDRSGLMHNKFCVADGERVWTGSANFTLSDVQQNFNNAVLITSPEVAENYTREFVEMFDLRLFGKRSPRDTPHPRLLLDDIPLEIYFAPEDRVQNEIIAEIAEARERVDFMMFSFTSEPLSEALLMRMLDNVAVRGIMEKSLAGQESSRDEFLALRGAEIYIDENDALFHHKVMIVDAKTVITGSYNYSAAAENTNDENVVIIESPAIAAQYLTVMESIINP